MKGYLQLIIILLLAGNLAAQRTTADFNSNWKFFLGNDRTASATSFNDTKWRNLSLPHDWSIELPFDEKAPATTSGGALPGGIGWYRKSFAIPLSSKDKKVFIEFDGVYRNSEVWINGHYLGKRPNGYISFRYELTSYLKYGQEKNIIAVKVDNSQQPNSRWYSGSGIYRNVRLVTENKIAFEQYGVVVTSNIFSSQKGQWGWVPYSNNKTGATLSLVKIQVALRNAGIRDTASVIHTIYDAAGKVVIASQPHKVIADSFGVMVKMDNGLSVKNPVLWSIDKPYLYTVVSVITHGNKVLDKIGTKFGIRQCAFNKDKGFFLNDVPLKIKGVCMHHDLGALGAAVNVPAIERQLKILKEMGCNAIRTAHNPPSPEFLDACDRMGFLVMDEAFDMWKKKKNKFDYYSDFTEWHKRDLEEQIKRDRNHPSVFMWSIGNEIREQFDSTGITIAKELVAIVKSLDTTRPVTCALSEPDPKKNFIYQSKALDIVGLNYHPEVYADFQKNYPGEVFIGAENMSALATRGHYDMPSDSMRYWPASSKDKTVVNGNADYTVSAYDNVAAYWGSSHEVTWKIIKKHDFLSGLFVWSGFDFLGEPVPYPWPARSSYYGIIDLAGFPKDVYYMYQSEWTNKPVLHIFPHWNWEPGKTVDVWAYYNNADEVELFLNGRSLGIKKKQGDDIHVMWRIPFEAGSLKAVSRKNGKTVLTKEIHTAGKPYKIELSADRNIIHADGKDICFVTARVVDEKGNLVPGADNLIKFSIKGEATVAGVDNGYPASMEPFKANQHKAYNGLCLAMVQSKQKAGNIVFTAVSEGLKTAGLTIIAR